MEHGPAILGPMRNLEALQLRLPVWFDGEWPPDIRNVEDPETGSDDIDAGEFSKYIRLWRRHNGLCDIPIRKLSLLVETGDDNEIPFDVQLANLDGISDAFPNLLDLDCTDVNADTDSFNTWPFIKGDDVGDVMSPRLPGWLVSHLKSRVYCSSVLMGCATVDRVRPAGQAKELGGDGHPASTLLRCSRRFR
jgi:hypothetical protein